MKHGSKIKNQQRRNQPVNRVCASEKVGTAMKRERNRAFRTTAIAMSVVLNASLAMAQQLVCSSAAPDASKALRGVVIVRPHVTITMLKSGSKGEGTAEQVEAGFQSALSQKFENQGFKPLLDPILMPEWEAKNALGVKALRDDFDAAYTTCCDCKTLLKSSFANDLEKLVDSDGFDGLVLARAEGTICCNWGGSDSLLFGIALISRNSGQIVHYCRSFASDGWVGDPYRSLSGPIQRCLQQWAKPKSR